MAVFLQFAICIFLKLLFFLIMCLCTCVKVPMEARGGRGIPGVRVQAVVSHLPWCWELNSDPLRKSSAHLSPLSHLFRLLYFGFPAGKHIQTILSVVKFDDVIFKNLCLELLIFESGIYVGSFSPIAHKKPP